MKKVYFLSTCDTCKRIIKDLAIGDEFEYQDIKKDPLTESQLDEMKQMAGSYESLFSRVARKYKELGMKDKQLSENDYRSYILSEYTFLKRPVFIIEENIYIGNSKKTIEQIKGVI
ncbi:arsenate reductase [Fulvivirga sp. M361]|uniref:arsenate reductase family protein n=1 Tax=Fulvivirga sp. M361 TaxID=2594266 RepID=UPI00117A52ED|nr:ArsC/Spx/MgsR family protein [Fulvivirga sp. M361]TRX58293.1 arsenate reductase [Fulvivirga sp. M361]